MYQIASKLVILSLNLKVLIEVEAETTPIRVEVEEGVVVMEVISSITRHSHIRTTLQKITLIKTLLLNLEVARISRVNIQSAKFVVKSSS